MASTEEDGIAARLAEAEALGSVGRWSAAADRAADAARMAPDDPRPYRAWAAALMGQRDYEEAARKADIAIRLAPEAYVGHQLRGRALVSLARDSSGAQRTYYAAEAIASGREGLRLAPWSAGCRLVLAEGLSLNGDLRGADRAAREAIEMAPNNPSSWVTASVVALRAKNWQAAISASRRALELDPQSYAALNNLGVALRASGQRRAGTHALAEAARINPDSVTARQNLSRSGLLAVRLVLMILLLPVLLIQGYGLLIYLAFSVLSNLVISRNRDLALRLEHIGAPVALFFAGKRHRVDPTGTPVPTSRRRRSVTADDRWSATVGHPKGALGNPVLIFCALAAWTVALLLLAGQIVFPDPNRAALVVGFVAFAALGVWPVAVARRRRRRQEQEWAEELMGDRSPDH